LHVGIFLINGEARLLGEEKENFLRKSALTSKEEKYIKESFFKNQILENTGSLEKLHIVRQEKIIASVGHVEK